MEWTGYPFTQPRRLNLPDLTQDGDRIMIPRPYFSSADRDALLAEKVIIIQSHTRGMMARVSTVWILLRRGRSGIRYAAGISELRGKSLRDNDSVRRKKPSLRMNLYVDGRSNADSIQGQRLLLGEALSPLQDI